MRIVSYPWDLVMTDSLFTASGYALAELSRAHHVMMHSTDVESGHGISKGYARLFRHYLTMPRIFMHFDNPTYDVRSFVDRLVGAYNWFGNWFVFAVLANSYMKRVAAPLLPHFDFTRYNAEASMSFTDMPLSLYAPASASNEVSPSNKLKLKFSIV
ncbi:unnamed protein product [Gongylonema pulchrum]|uniref:Glyco_trans_2-like domain-containing protein n=1 Tax=Gongylonema pulchrum TaxID=637853 RepID=A0A183DAT7_9BILA|nr:unnamed protein product [Gongylonema pulchrum]